MNATKHYLDFPFRKISNGVLSLTLDASNVDNPYCSGVRFDRAGRMFALEFGGHSYFAEWFPEYNPTAHDAVCGLPEEFSPLGYDDASIGETFLKIGVGELVRDSSSPYDFTHNYELANVGDFRAEYAESSATWFHSIKNACRGAYSYEYKKSVVLTSGLPRIEICHELCNVGKSAISFSVYNHNFFVFDGKGTGKATQIILPFEPKAPFKVLSGLGLNGVFEKNRVVFLRDFSQSDRFSVHEIAFPQNAGAEEIEVKNSDLAVGVKIRSSLAPYKASVWARDSVACVEPFIKIDVAPDQKISWALSYDLTI